MAGAYFCAMASLVSGFLTQPNLAGSLLLLFFIGLMAVANRLDDKLRMGLSAGSIWFVGFACRFLRMLLSFGWLFF